MDNKNSHVETVWSFDIGTGSFGYAVRRSHNGQHDMVEVKSLLVPHEFASTKPARDRRRMHRTREAHLAREDWLRQCFQNAGLSDAVLRGRKPVEEVDPITGKSKWRTEQADWRLEREFPPTPGARTKDGAPSDAAGAATCYCGALLRIKLLQGEPLASWQIYKALHNAIQKRGFDPEVPWKNRGRGEKRDDDDAGVTLTRANDAEKEIVSLSPDHKERWMPCYLEAHEMGLWHPDAPEDTSKLRQDHHARPAKGRVYLRETVERELRALLVAAEKQLPALRGQTDLVLYGPAGVAYASYNAKPETLAAYKKATGKDLIEGKAADWQGVLGQKIPTFDNRAVQPCALITRFHAAKAAPRIRKKTDGTLYLDEDSLLPAEVSFLMKLKNFRFAKTGGEQGRFTPALVREMFADRRKEVLAKNKVETFAFTKTALMKWIGRLGGVALLADQDKVEAPKTSGRSRFSKPALRLVKELILSGEAPVAFHAKALARLGGNVDEKKGLIADDLDFLLRIKASGGAVATWENFYLPDESLSFVDGDTGSSAEKIREMIGRQNNPIVRHRLETFWRLLQNLGERHGKPDYIALEFVREDFMGEKAKLELAKFQKDRREARAEAREKVGGGKDMLRYQLLKDQGGVCLYCGESIGLSDLSGTHLDHIVPDALGGPGAYWNFCVCCGPCNDAKKRRTPHQWFQEDNRAGWDAYTARVRARTFQLKPKKVRLLTLPHEEVKELVQRYQSLAETAWIARLAQALACLHFGWPHNFAGGKRKVVVLPGGLTARVRRKYNLNNLLGQDIAALEAKLKEKGDAKTEAEIDKKCRADKRHHALDAMVLSFISQGMVDPNHPERVKLPDHEGVHREFFAKYLGDVVPSNLCFEKPALEESAYGRRLTPVSGKEVGTKRFELKELGLTGINPVFKLETLKKDAAKILDPAIRAAVQEFIKTYAPDGDAWLAFCESFRQPVHADGPQVKRVRLVVAETLDEFTDVSKGDKRPALKRGDRHQGYYLYTDLKGKVRVRPVYAFQSPAAVRKALLAQQGKEVIEIIDFFQSGCAVTLSETVDHPKTPLQPGEYKLNSIWFDGRAKVTSATGVLSEPIQLQKLLQAGFARPAIL